MHSHGFSPHLLALVLLPFMTLFGDSEDDHEDEANEHSQVGWLRSLHDREALYQIMQRDQQLTQGLEAAEALAELGDVRGLDHLIATLKSPSSYLRHQAAQILERLNHPRGLRALKQRSGLSPGSGRGPQRDQLYDELNARDTDELVAIWHQNDRTHWSEMAFEVLADLLNERLGRLPPRDDESLAHQREDVDENVDPRVRELWIRGDVDALVRLYDDATDVPLQLEAAEALSALGDEEALDVLVEALDDPDPNIGQAAAELLDWLDMPRGNAALEDRGIEFETGADTMSAAPAQAAPAGPASQAPSAAPDSWFVQRPVPAIPQASPLGTTQAATAQTVWQQAETASHPSPAILLAGLVGGLLGFLVFRLALHFLGILQLPRDSAGWLHAKTLFLMGVSLLVGASFGVPGSRIALAISRRLGWETGEGDLTPVLGALVEGATSALLADVLLFSIFGP